MQSSVHYLNLEYFLVRTYEILTGFHFDTTVSSFPDRLSAILTGIAYGGLFLAFIILILLVYVSIRLLQVEHEGFHAMEKHHHEHHAAAIEHAEASSESARWDNIVTLANSPSHSEWRRAILEADIMLSDVLNNQGYVGETVADQLRQANPFQMTTLDLAWSAHKVRNQIAHQGEKLDLTERDVRATIDLFRRVFEEFGAI